jgi:hypothetical protein
VDVEGTLGLSWNLTALSLSERTKVSYVCDRDSHGEEQMIMHLRGGGRRGWDNGVDDR